VNLEEMEQIIAGVNGRLTLLDNIIKGAKLGLPKVLAFRCNHSGLYFPADYVKGWGKGYGVGLGPDPVSEVLDSDYDTAPPAINDNTREIESIMHPLVCTRMQVDLVEVNEAEYEDGRAVLASQDPRMRARARICRDKQLKNPRGRLRAIQASWDKLAMKVG